MSTKDHTSKTKRIKQLEQKLANLEAEYHVTVDVVSMLRDAVAQLQYKVSKLSNNQDTNFLDISNRIGTPLPKSNPMSQFTCPPPEEGLVYAYGGDIIVNGKDKLLIKSKKGKDKITIDIREKTVRPIGQYSSDEY